MNLSLLKDQKTLEAFGAELDAVGAEIKSSLGTRDRQYIQRMIRIERTMALGGRALIYASLPFALTPLFLPLIGAGTASLGLAKILENMEIGHNIIHGQWDWMCDPAIHSRTWEWDNVCPADQWKHSHNVMHHTWTNVLGKDRDVGYEILRMSERQEWKPAYLFQPVYAFVLAVLFEWGIAFHDIDIQAAQRGERTFSSLLPQLRGIGRKVLRQVLKDYVLFPLAAGPFFLPVLLANIVANGMRNLWSYAIIFCGHFPDGVHHFTEEDIEGETRARWYLRQILGSCNIDGGPLFHVMSGNLSFQIEHHLFPDLPSNRYAEAAVRVREICSRYGVPYNTASFGRQLGTTLRTIFRLSLPTSGITARA